MSKSLGEIAAELCEGADPDTLAQEVGWDRINDAIDMLEDRI